MRRRVRRGYEVVVMGVGKWGPATRFQAVIVAASVANEWKVERGWRVVIRPAAIKDGKPARRARRQKR